MKWSVSPLFAAVVATTVCHAADFAWLEGEKPTSKLCLHRRPAWNVRNSFPVDCGWRPTSTRQGPEAMSEGRHPPRL